MLIPSVNDRLEVREWPFHAVFNGGSNSFLNEIAHTKILYFLLLIVQM